MEISQWILGIVIGLGSMIGAGVFAAIGPAAT